MYIRQFLLPLPSLVVVVGGVNHDVATEDGVLHPVVIVIIGVLLPDVVVVSLCDVMKDPAAVSVPRPPGTCDISSTPLCTKIIGDDVDFVPSIESISSKYS